jgi:uncharacterized membrane protein
MPSKRNPEGLEIVLSQVLVAVLTLITVVPLCAVLALANPAGEVAIAVIAFGAWNLVLALAVPFLQKVAADRDPEKAP